MSQFIQVLISHLDLDPENPRLPEKLRTKATSESEVLNWMLEDATLVDLIASIAENGFFPGEPIIVVAGSAKGRYTVIEGNRRLAAIKLLQDPSIAEVSSATVRKLSEFAYDKRNVPLDVSVFIAPDRDSVDNYLGFRHITGVKQWPTISKARYLYKLFKKKEYYDGIFRELAREIGSKGVYVKRLIYGYELFLKIKKQNYYGLDLEESNFNLSLITDASVMYSAIADYMGFNSEMVNPTGSLNEENFKEVVKWLYETDSNGVTRIGETRNLRVLNKVLQSPRAKKAFLKDKKTLREAAQLTDILDESIREFLMGAYNSLLEAQKQAHLSEHPKKEDIQLLDDIISSADFIQSQLKKVLRTKQDLVV
jgi:hypothetical protein